MSRAETTAMLSELVEKRLRNQTAFWANLNFDGLPCSTPRQEAIWMEYNGITRGED
ncbi:MAG: hypothetical protein ACLTDO_04680 [Bifidobacterium pseudocatenulatum]